MLHRSTPLAACAIAMAVFSATARQSFAAAIPIPNAGFETIQKPGNPGVTETSFSWFSNGVGIGVPLSNCCGSPSNILTWSDNTTSNAGDPIDVPGWVTSSGATGIQSTGNPGNGIYTQGPGFGGPAGGSTVDSAASLGTIAANTNYTLTMDAAGINGPPASPSLLQLLANGSPVPDATVLPNVTNAGWITYSITFPAATLLPYVGDDMKIRFGTGPGAQGAQIQWDNATLTATAVPEPTSVVLACLGAVGLLAAARRRR